MYKIHIDTTVRFKHIVRLIKDATVMDEVFGDIDVATEVSNILKTFERKASNACRDV